MALISIGQVVDQSIHHYRTRFTELMEIALWLFAGIPFAILGRALKPEVTDVLSPQLVVSGVLGLIAVALTAFAGAWVLTGIVALVRAQHAGNKIDLRAIRKTAWKRVWHMVALLIAIVALVLGALLLVLPGFILTILPALTSIPSILAGLGVFMLFAGGVASLVILAWLGITLSLAPAALVLGEQSAFGAIGYARKLVEGRWWAVMFRMIIPKLTILVLVFFAQYVLFNVLGLAIASMTSISFTTASVLYDSLKNIMLTGLTTLMVPMYVIADYYVYDSLVDTRGK